MDDFTLNNIIDRLWQWLATDRGRPAIKDTTRISSVKYDCYLDSSVSDPMSFSVFRLSDRGELLVDDVSRLVESKAAYFLFVNTDKQFVVMVKNTLENCKKLVHGEKVDNLKVRIVT